VFLFLLLIVFFQPPLIYNVSPTVALPGDVITVDGVALGKADPNAWVTIGGNRIANADILDWDRSRISFRLPYSTHSGRLQVHTSSGFANGPLMINKDQVPRIVNQGDMPDVVLFSAVPNPVGAGQEVIVRGKNLGQGTFGTSLSFDGVDVLREAVSQWNDREIRFLMPEISHKVLLTVKTAAGTSNDLPLKITHTGVNLRPGKVQEWLLTLGYNVGDVERNTKETWGAVHVYLPQPASSREQTVDFQEFKGEFTRVVVPQLGFEMYSINDPRPDRSYSLKALWRLQRMSLRVELNPGQLPVATTTPSELLPWLKSSDLVPCQAPELLAFVKSKILAEDHPWVKARKLYDAVTDALALDTGAGLAFAPEVLKDRKGNTFGFSNLYTALLRVAGVPARMVEGLLVGTTGTAEEHFWVEFHISGAGWVSADPFLGKGGVAQASVAPGITNHDYYFGGIDNRHLTLVRGENLRGLSRIDQSSQKLFRHLVLMDTHAEGEGAVDSYGLSMPDPQVQVLGGERDPSGKEALIAD